MPLGTNQNSGYGQAQIGGIPFTTGKVFLVDDTSGSNTNAIDALFTPDGDGVQRRLSTITAALAACTAGHGDIVLLAPDFSTAPTGAELLAAETKGVKITKAGDENGVLSVDRITTALPATTAEAIFTVTGKVKILSIIGEVTTVIETQANDTKLVANPTVGADVDLCAVLDISADAVGTNYTITGTLANAMVDATSGAYPYTASPVVVTAGTIDLDCAATNTGSVKWKIQYEPIDPGASIFAA